MMKQQRRQQLEEDVVFSSLISWKYHPCKNKFMTSKMNQANPKTKEEEQHSIA